MTFCPRRAGGDPLGTPEQLRRRLLERLHAAGQVAGDAEVHAVPVTGDRRPAGHEPFPVQSGPRPGMPVGSGGGPGACGDEALPCLRAIDLQDAGGAGDRERPHDGVGS